MSKVYLSKWYSFNICYHCFYRFKDNGFLKDEYYDSDGTCVNCGEHGFSLPDKRVVTLREFGVLRPDREWYEFWKSKYTLIDYEARDNVSQQYIDKVDKEEAVNDTE